MDVVQNDLGRSNAQPAVFRRADVERLADVFEQQRAADITVAIRGVRVKAKRGMTVFMVVAVRVQAWPAQPVAGAPAALLHQNLRYSRNHCRV